MDLDAPPPIGHGSRASLTLDTIPPNPRPVHRPPVSQSAPNARRSPDMDRRPHRRLLLSLLLLASSLHGCTCAHQRGAVYPPASRPDDRDEIRVRAPFVDVRVPRPAEDRDRPSRSDVPILED